MKIFKSVILIVTVFLAFLSCQKELVFDNNGLSAGAFKKDGAGNCQPVVVNGVFKVDSVLTNALFVDIQVNATTPGTFDIKSDTINGYSFSKAGTVVFGINTIRLYPSGKPILAGKNTFTVRYGTSTCSFEITVNGPAAPAATFTLGGSPGACTGAVVGGTYTANTALTPANTLTIQVNVSNPGTYVIGAVAASGFIFNGSGVFTSAGLQNVTLTGSGTPLTAGTATVTVTNLSSSCTFDITVLPSGGGTPAVYTLDGASGNCTSFIVNGTYTAGSATTVTNTVTLNVSVTTAGTYTITTNTANGISFSKTGVFTTTGPQVVSITATGIPVAQGPFSFSPSTGSGGSTCNFIVNFLPAAPPPPSPDYFPLTNNSWWSYTIIGNAPADTAYSLIYGTKAYNGNTYTEVENDYAGVPNDTAHYRKSGNDYWDWTQTDSYSAFIPFDSPPVYADIDFLRENATAGTTWTTGPFNGTTNTGVPNDPASVKYVFTIANPNTSVTINSVAYTNVIHVTVVVKFTVASLGITDGVTENDDYYYAKGIGLIKIVYTPTALIGGGPSYEVDVKNYKVF
jgi:hypothetical protein